MIIFNPCEESFAERIIKFTHPLAYKYLMTKLSKRNNYAVYWNQSSQFAKSEWIIFRSQDIERLKRRSHDETIEMLDNSIIAVDDSFESKYNVVDKHGILKPAKVKNSAGELIC